MTALATLTTFNETVRFCDELNSDLKYFYPCREDADHLQIRLTALHSVMNHRADCPEY